MARINSNISSLIARANLGRANEDLETRLQRLATGVKINRGADNPAGLIISERLRSEIAGSNQAINNSQRASSVIATAEGALAEVSDLLNSIRSLVVEAANTGALSDEERAANQLQIDSAIESITRISNTASFGGLKLLNGSLDYVLSGLQSDAVAKAQIYSANFASQSNIQVDINVISSAQVANLYMSGGATGSITSTTTLEIAGSLGVQVLEFEQGRPLSEVIAGINSFKAATGVSAALLDPLNSAAGLQFSSTAYGAKSFVSVKRLGGPPGGGYFRTFELPASAQIPTTISFGDPTFVSRLSQSNHDTGRDVTAIVNGVVGSGNGLSISVQNSTSLSLGLSLQEDFATTNGSSSTFHITGGGALYQLGGEISTNLQTNIGIQSVAASRLGGTLIDGSLQFLSSLRSGGTNDLNSQQFESSSRVLATALDEVSVLRGRLGAFEKNTLQTNVRSLQAAVENLTSSESSIRDADFAAETSALTRAQILTSAGTSVLGLANQQAQQVLQLLG